MTHDYSTRKSELVALVILIASIVAVWYYNHWTVSLILTLVIALLLGLAKKLMDYEELLYDALHNCTKKEDELVSLSNEVNKNKEDIIKIYKELLKQPQ